MSKGLKRLLFLLLIFIVFFPFFKLAKKGKKQIEIVEGKIKEGDIIGNILKREGISDTESHYIIERLKEIFDPRKSKVGDIFQIHFDKNRNFLKFRYFEKPFNYYIVEKQNGKYFSYVEEVEKYKKIFQKSGVIKNSLYESMTSININPEMIIQFAEIFESKIDFLTDCKKDDKFSIVWETWTDKNGEILKDIRILAGKYELDNKKFYAFWFEKGNFNGFFDENGKGLQSGFLKAPLSYRRITSFFSYSRFHPIYKIYRPHLGIDYSAPIGTPVSSIGNGIVIFSGWVNNGYGKCVKIKHPNGYISYYGHLSRIENGIKNGVKVKKGDVIGYVGMTGIATGPHLDFRLKKDGKFINFLKLKFVPEKNVPLEYINEFNEIKNNYIKILENKNVDPGGFEPPTNGL